MATASLSSAHALNGSNGSSMRSHLRLVVVAEEHLVCQGLAALLARSPQVETHCAGSVSEALKRVPEVHAHAMVLWTTHADHRTLEELDRLRLRDGLPVCVITETLDVDAFRQALLSRADGLAMVLRRQRLEPVDLFRIIVQLVAGRIVLTPLLLEQLVRDSRAAEHDLLDDLTVCEKDVLGLVAMGLRNGAIARRLGRSKKLVEKHIGRSFMKLGLSADDLDIDRRVTAARMYLQATSGVGSTPLSRR